MRGKTNEKKEKGHERERNCRIKQKGKGDGYNIWSVRSINRSAKEAKGVIT